VTVRAAATRLCACALVGGCAGAPQYLSGDGPAARAEASLGWMLTVTSIVVAAIVAGLVLAAVLRRRPPGGGPLGSARAGVRWIVVGGMVLPALILVVAFAITLGTLRAVAAPPSPPALTVRVTGHRWWWQVEYLRDSGQTDVATANELHIPVGRPVRLQLEAADVIHSFWVPRLAGKTDVIPGQHNLAWIQADHPGVYWAQCAEYCGVQHAHMQLRVVADSPGEFAAWLAQQRDSAPPPATPAAALGRDAFLGAACSLCHTVRGTNAHGTVGPDLTHVGSRLTLAAGLLPNNRGNLAGWIANPQTLKPGTLMPTVPLRGEQLQAVATYLESLK